MCTLNQATLIPTDDRSLKLLLALSVLRERAKKDGREEDVKLIDEAVAKRKQ